MPAAKAITRLAAELHINDFPMTEAQTTMQTIRVGSINPLTGHMYTNDNVAAFCTLQPDCPDPPHDHSLGEDSLSDLLELPWEETLGSQEEYPWEVTQKDLLQHLKGQEDKETSLSETHHLSFQGTEQSWKCS